MAIDQVHGIRKVGRYTLLTVMAVIVFFPIYMMVVGALKPGNKLLLRPLIPSDLTLETLREAWRDGHLGRALVNSAVVSVVITVAQVVTAILAAYAFAFLKFPGKTIVFALFLATLLVPLEATLTVNRRTMQDLDWINSYKALTVPFLATAFGIFMIRQVFLTIPKEMHEAASMDGLGHFGFMREVAVPLSRPTIGALALFSFLSSWNQYLWPNLVTTDADYNTVQTGLKALKSAVDRQAESGDCRHRDHCAADLRRVDGVPTSTHSWPHGRGGKRLTMRKSGRSLRNALPAIAAAALLAAACGNGKSLTNAGIDRPPTPVVTNPAPTVPGQTTIPAETTMPPTTLPRLLDSLPACNTEALDAAGGTVEITFWHGLTNELGRELERLTGAYNASQSKVKVNLEFQGGYEQTIDKYLQSNTANRPDLVQTPEYMVQQMIDTESIVPVQACAESAKYDLTQLLPQALSAYATEGVQWSMPFNVSVPVLYYVKPTFTRAGLDPEKAPQSLEELLSVGKQIVSSGAAPYSISVDSDFDGGGGWYIEQWLAKAGEFYADNENGRAAPATRVVYDGPAGAELLTYLQTLVTEGGGVYVGDNASGQDSLLKLADPVAPAAMTISTSAGLGPVLNILDSGLIAGVTRTDLGIGFMPGPNGGVGALVGGASLYVVADKGDAKAAAAWDYIAFLMSAQSQSEWAAATGYIPVNKGALDLDPIKSLYVTDPRFKVAYDQLLGTVDAPTARGPVLGPLKQVRRVTAAAVAVGIERRRCAGRPGQRRPTSQRSDHQLQRPERLARGEAASGHAVWSPGSLWVMPFAFPATRWLRAQDPKVQRHPRVRDRRCQAVHRHDGDHPWHHRHRARCDQRAKYGQQLRLPCRLSLLRRHHFPPHHQRFHVPGWRPDRHRDGRAWL